MTIPLGVALTALVAILAAVFYRASSKAAADRRNRFVQRTAVSDQEFLSGCGVNDPAETAVVLDLRNSIALELEIPEDKIRPSDRFDVELRPLKGWEFDDGVNLLMQKLLAARYKSKLPTNTKEICSVKNYVAAWLECTKENSKGPIE